MSEPLLQTTREHYLKVVSDRADLLEALKELISACENNSGYEPSLSVYHRAIDQAKEIATKAEAKS